MRPQALVLAALLLAVPLVEVATPTATAFCQTQSVAVGPLDLVVRYDDGRGFTCRLGLTACVGTECIVVLP